MDISELNELDIDIGKILIDYFNSKIFFRFLAIWKEKNLSFFFLKKNFLKFAKKVKYYNFQKFNKTTFSIILYSYI